MPDNANAATDSLERGVAFLRQQDSIYARNAWVARWVGWLCGWGGSALAAFAGVSTKLFKDSENLPVWCGLIAALLIAVNQVIKPESWADAYYRGHLLLEGAIGDYALGKATPEALSDAWHQAENGLPGASGIASPRKNIAA